MQQVSSNDLGSESSDSGNSVQYVRTAAAKSVSDDDTDSDTEDEDVDDYFNDTNSGASNDPVDEGAARNDDDPVLKGAASNDGDPVVKGAASNDDDPVVEGAASNDDDPVVKGAADNDDDPVVKGVATNNGDDPGAASNDSVGTDAHVDNVHCVDCSTELNPGDACPSYTTKDLDYRYNECFDKHMSKEYVDIKSVRKQQNKNTRASKKNTPASRSTKKNTPASRSTKKNTPASRSTKKNTASSKNTRASLKDIPLGAGMKVSCKWSGKQHHGKWFEGTIKSVDTRKKTAYVTYDDGDVDHSVPWDDIYIISAK